ncbi:MAG: hypothetical protein FJ088_09100 [Deltaproteobacteria bacterium]|nr:hypothetical protein [Deltaproteobacteria bacterium]
MSVLESLLEMEETGPAKLLTDGEILNIVSNELSGKSKSVKERYKAAYGDTPPLRISGEGYEARIFHNNELSPWKPVETPRHKVIGGIELLEAIPLCVSNPGLLDCAWAALGCVRPDLDQDGTVDDADKTIFETASAQFKDIACGSKNQWCSGADLDYTGAVDAVDSAFMTAALGCRY